MKASIRGSVTRIVSVLVSCLALLILAPGNGSAQQTQGQDTGPAVVLDVRGAIGPATAEYLRQGFSDAQELGASLIVVQLDTPGGLVTSMREIVQMFLASPVPVVTYVEPRGARAASAGTYMLYGSHLAAMAPGTHLGAATPVQMGGAPPPPNEEDDTAPADPMTAKSVNDAVAYIRALAELQGRNADWAEQAVREAATLTANEALEREVIEIIAPDLRTLLAEADGRVVRLDGQDAALATAGIEVVELPPGWRAQLLGILANPNIAYIMMLIGIYGIIFEFLSPGAIFPGVIGGISLLLALFALNLLPLNIAGIGLLLLGIALMTAEAFAPSFGVLGMGGALAFALGSFFMFDEVPGFELSLGVVLAATAASLALLAVALAAAVRAHRRKVVSDDASMVGAEGEVLSWSGGHGTVHIHGERWQARGDAELPPGARVRVRGRDGLTLSVEPAAPIVK